MSPHVGVVKRHGLPTRFAATLSDISADNLVRLARNNFEPTALGFPDAAALRLHRQPRVVVLVVLVAAGPPTN